MTALKEQVGGDHYKRLQYQPHTFAMDLRAAGGVMKVAKYLSRNKLDRTEDLMKARHVMCLDEDWVKDSVEKMNQALGGDFFKQFGTRFGEIWEDSVVDYYGDDDDELIERFFEQFAGTGDAFIVWKMTKQAFYQYVKGNLPAAKGLMTKAINYEKAHAVWVSAK
ncbi:hypothetical protein CPT_Phriendly_025 [Vibrio phage Phriendly]|nr:hypothetical protein CPT_Phriendly_025 [Vibrio phage Phriendly]